MPCCNTMEHKRGPLERVGNAIADGDDEVEVSGIEQPPFETLVFLDAACPDDLDLEADDFLDGELLHTLSQLPARTLCAEPGRMVKCWE